MLNKRNTRRKNKLPAITSKKYWSISHKVQPKYRSSVTLCKIHDWAGQHCTALHMLEVTDSSSEAISACKILLVTQYSDPAQQIINKRTIISSNGNNLKNICENFTYRQLVKPFCSTDGLQPIYNLPFLNNCF